MFSNSADEDCLDDLPDMFENGQTDAASGYNSVEKPAQKSKGKSNVKPLERLAKPPSLPESDGESSDGDKQR